MARLEWDKESERLYETGVKNCALYPWTKAAGTADKYVKLTNAVAPSDWAVGTTDKYYSKNGSTYTAITFTEEESAVVPAYAPNTYYVKTKEDGYGKGVAWNGITAVNETPTGAEATDLYADDMKYLSLLSAEELEGTVEAYTYPDEWEQCDGSASSDGVTFGQQARKQFCLAYITTVGNDTEGNDFGEKLHIMYNCKASPSERAYNTINDSPEAITFSWPIKATKMKISDANKAAMEESFNMQLKDTALITINKVDKNGDKTPHYDEIYNKLFGTDEEDAKVLTPDEICAIMLGNG